MVFAATNLPLLPAPPTTVAGRRGVASAVSMSVHVAVVLIAISGILPKATIPVVPPDMVVEVVLEPPPPPPPPPPPEPQQALPQPVVPQPVAPRPPKAVPQVKAAPIPTQTTPSPDANAVPLPAPVAPAPAAPVAEEQTYQPPPQVSKPVSDPEGTKIYLSGIKGRVQEKVVYPTLSLKRGEQGTVHVHTSLSRDGTVVDISAEEEGNSLRLREAAIKAIKDAAPFPPMPDGVPGDPVKITIPVVFEIK